MTKLDSTLKSRHYFVIKSPYCQGSGFSSGHVWMCELYCEESWVPKSDAFELWCWKRLLRVPWTARRSNQYILKEISPEYLLEELMLKLKLQYFGYLMRRTDSFEETNVGKDWRWEEKGTTDGWMASLTQWTWVWVSSGSWWWSGKSGILYSTGLQSRTWLSDWTDVC